MCMPDAEHAGMSIGTEAKHEVLRKVLQEWLGDRAVEYAKDIAALVANDYSDEEALKAATRDGLKEVPGLTPGKIDELLAKFSGAATVLNCTL